MSATSFRSRSQMDAPNLRLTVCGDVAGCTGFGFMKLTRVLPKHIKAVSGWLGRGSCMATTPDGECGWLGRQQLIIVFNKGLYSGHQIKNIGKSPIDQPAVRTGHGIYKHLFWYNFAV